jgi:hypothetical protein
MGFSYLVKSVIERMLLDGITGKKQGRRSSRKRERKF